MRSQPGCQGLLGGAKGQVVSFRSKLPTPITAFAPLRVCHPLTPSVTHLPPTHLYSFHSLTRPHHLPEYPLEAQWGWKHKDGEGAAPA